MGAGPGPGDESWGVTKGADANTQEALRWGSGGGAEGCDFTRIRWPTQARDQVMQFQALVGHSMVSVLALFSFLESHAEVLQEGACW